MRILDRKLIKVQNWTEVNQKLQEFTRDISNATTFVREIEKGNLDASIHETKSATELSDSLVSMRDQMKKFSLEDQERRWVNEGLAKFVEILRAKDESLGKVANNIVTQLVNYLGANQGALYLVNDDNPKDVFIEMAACYAYNRKKHITQRIELGQGLTGQAVLEKGTIYMTDLPNDYIKITSGLGEALPRNVLVVPMKIEERVFGVIEIASFQLLKKYEIEFVEKLGESIASTIASVKVAERTKRLLQETQQQAEEMKAQEEEMRQNMEELSATQEEMQRVLREVEAKEAYISTLLNVSSDSIFTIDKEYKLVTWNSAFARSLDTFAMRLAKGIDTMDWYSAAEKQKQAEIYQRAFNGESFEFTAPIELNGATYHFMTMYAPLRNEKGEVYEVAIFSKDVTNMVKAQDEIVNLINASTDSILTIDRNYHVLSCNTIFQKTYQGTDMVIGKGFDIRKLFADEAEAVKNFGFYQRAFAGESFETTERYKFGDIDAYYQVSYVPLKNGATIDAIAIFVKDITEVTRAKNDVEASEKYIKGLLDVSGDAIMTIGRDNKIILFNETYRASFAPLGIEIKSSFDVLSLFDEAKRPEKQAVYDRIFGGETYEMIDHLALKGVDYYYQVKHAPLFESDGSIKTIAIFAKDISGMMKAKKETEALLAQTQQQGEELKAQEEELRQNMEEMNAQQEDMEKQLSEIRSLKNDLETREKVFGETTILSEADTHGTITYVNDKFCEVSGYAREELIGQPHSILRHPEMPKELFKKMWSTIKKGEVFKGIIKNRTKDGGHYWVDATIVPVKDEDGQITKYVGARYHITNDEMAIRLFRRN